MSREFQPYSPVICSKTVFRQLPRPHIQLVRDRVSESRAHLLLPQAGAQAQPEHGVFLKIPARPVRDRFAPGEERIDIAGIIKALSLYKGMRCRADTQIFRIVPVF